MRAPDDDVARAAMRDMAQVDRDLEAYDEALADGDPETVERSRRWWETLLKGRILDRGEKRLRGTQNRN